MPNTNLQAVKWVFFLFEGLVLNGENGLVNGVVCY
jgi:hypothetical protein